MALPVLAPTISAADAGDYAVPVGNGYELVRGNSHEIFISNAERQVVIPGKITKYAVINHWVLGYVIFPDWPDAAARNLFPDVVEGYFLLDTKTNKSSKGLTLENLREHLKARGIKAIPPMQAPHHS